MISTYKAPRDGLTSTFFRDGLADDAADGLIQAKHVEENAANLG